MPARGVANQYSYTNPRIPGFGLIDQSSPQAMILEVTDEPD
jgi:hypothetical protein